MLVSDVFAIIHILTTSQRQEEEEGGTDHVQVDFVR
jgi:hypothetical protein